ncbi:uncharacterized protein LOC129885438 [Solanum dulcamara]|uniref:uncharacterized protein LOC129885438 n=1 Tax=Solanum dulcamara TaxID=45834 RepID=UPI0024854D10|nr:uncharacterized protein LOC129885438 [Solanum dulcamara]
MEAAVEVKDFRPIKRIKLVIDKLISANQHAFIEGRKRTDTAIVANEFLDQLLKSKKKGIACKLDQEKAYDHVNWSCLQNIFKQMNFCDKWIGWIRYCISTVGFSIMIRGSPHGFFKAQRGLGPGDLLSPYLFTLVMEVLSMMIRWAENFGWIKGMSFGRTGGDSVTISHILYADDTLLLCEAHRKHLL